VWRGFTALNEDLRTVAPNSHEYYRHPDGVAPVEAWPMPVDGYKIRVYNLDDGTGRKPHCYRHRTSMTNLPWPIARKPRALNAMSPHTHEDFEQVSIIHSGTMVHHMRRPGRATSPNGSPTSTSSSRHPRSRSRSRRTSIRRRRFRPARRSG